MGKQEILTFSVKFDLEGQGQLHPQTLGILTKVFCTYGPNLVVLGCKDGEFWCREAQNGVIWIFMLNLTLKVKVDRSTKQ